MAVVDKVGFERGRVDFRGGCVGSGVASDALSSAMEIRGRRAKYWSRIVLP